MKWNNKNPISFASREKACLGPHKKIFNHLLYQFLKELALIYSSLGWQIAIWTNHLSIHPNGKPAWMETCCSTLRGTQPLLWFWFFSVIWSHWDETRETQKEAILQPSVSDEPSHPFKVEKQHFYSPPGLRISSLSRIPAAHWRYITSNVAMSSYYRQLWACFFFLLANIVSCKLSFFFFFEFVFECEVAYMELAFFPRRLFPSSPQ